MIKDAGLTLGIFFLLIISLVSLHSVAPFIFPLYYIYVAFAVLAYLLFSKIELEILSIFSWQIYIACIIFLALPLLIGQVTRGAIRWIPLGALTIQPSEIVRPFLFLFFASYLTQKEIDVKKVIFSLLLLALPLVLILLQPSLGVAFLTVVGYLGVLFASGVGKKFVLTTFILAMVAVPISWFLLAPYQKDRVISFVTPQADPSGAGYNSLQSMIAVGAGEFWGRGLGKGVQTQLSFLPERHSDFIFASIAEEMGFLGAVFVIIGLLYLLGRLVIGIENARNLLGRVFLTGVFLSLFTQSFIHMGMNMGLLPITGVPLPLVSAGGSSLVATMIMLGMVVAVKKKV